MTVTFSGSSIFYRKESEVLELISHAEKHTIISWKLYVKVPEKQSLSLLQGQRSTGIQETATFFVPEDGEIFSRGLCFNLGH